MNPTKDIYNSLFLNNHLVILIIDPDTGRIKNANKKAAEFYGYNYDDLLKLRIMDINILSEDEIKCEMKKAISGKKNFFKFQHRLKSGEIKNVSVSSGKVLLNGKEHLYSVIIDVSDSSN